jgi:GTP cyclohydrolase I
MNVGANQIVLTWKEVEQAVAELHLRASTSPVERPRRVFGIPTGGSVVAALLARIGNYELVETAENADLIVDDLVDSGKTMAPYDRDTPTDALFRKPTSPAYLAPNAIEKSGWLVFPWEKTEGSPEDAVVRLLEYIGEDPNRDGLVETPKRVCKAWRELTQGYGDDAALHLSKVFNDSSDEMVVVSGIGFSSLCEHHILPFTGSATVAYIPNGKVVGLSKIARCVDSFSQRLQVQERLTNQIAEAMMKNLNPKGVAVMLTATHACMALRGVRKNGASMTTSSLRGCFYDDAKARAEFLALARASV